MKESAGLGGHDISYRYLDLEGFKVFCKSMRFHLQSHIDNPAMPDKDVLILTGGYKALLKDELERIDRLEDNLKNEGK